MDRMKGTITRRMDSVLNGLQEEFRALYDIEDFESKLDSLKKAGEQSDRSSKLKKLFDMFDACGIAYERGMNNAYYEDIVRNADIPDFSEIEDRMLYALYTRYREYPSPEEYMERMVNRLSSDEDDWGNDTLRVRILKQFIKYGGYLEDAGFSGKTVIRGYVKEKLGKKQKLSDEEILDALDDGVFAVLETADKKQKRPNGKFGLLKAVDDLAGGKFRVEGATKRSLYLFAMVYGMTYCSGSGDDGEILDFRTDIETNLFQDYYTNNLMRFISDAYRGKLCEYELDPSGQGINYKNFAEMIYLYYISKDCSPRDKIRLSGEMIKRVQDSRFRKGKPEAGNSRRDTVFYRNFFRNGNGDDLFSEDILNLPESEFEKFICDNYDCDTFIPHESGTGMGGGKTGVFQLETEQNSAFREYRSILDDLEKLKLPFENSNDKSEYNCKYACNYGLWFSDIAAFQKKGYENICDRRTDIDRDKFEEFMELLLGINSFMGCAVDEAISGKTKTLSAGTVTRTSMITAWYYYYNLLHEDDGKDKWKSFEELFNNFKKDIDVKLEAAYYQPLSGKNIFDVLVVFSSYAYLNT